MNTLKKEIYTLDDRHPEDAIYEVTKFIRKLGEVQDEQFDKLCKNLKIPNSSTELFDFIYNSSEESFDDYIYSKYGQGCEAWIEEQQLEETKD